MKTSEIKKLSPCKFPHLVQNLENIKIILTAVEGNMTYIASTGTILPRVEDEGNMVPVEAIYVILPETNSQYFYYYPNQTSRANTEIQTIQRHIP